MTLTICVLMDTQIGIFALSLHSIHWKPSRVDLDISMNQTSDSSVPAKYTTNVVMGAIGTNVTIVTNVTAD